MLAFVAGLGFSLKFLVDITTVFTKGGWLLMDSEDWLFFGIEGATVLLAFFYSEFLGAIFRNVETKAVDVDGTETTEFDAESGDNKK